MATTDPAGNRPDPPRLTRPERKEFIRRGHELRARMSVGRQGLTDAFVAQLDQDTGKIELFKVRLETETGDEATLMAEELAARIGAEVVQRVGRVALFYRPVHGDNSGE